MKEIINLSWRGPLSYRNQSIDLQSKSEQDWFLYDNSLRHERVKLFKIPSEFFKRVKLKSVKLSSIFRQYFLNEAVSYSYTLINFLQAHVVKV